MTERWLWTSLAHSVDALFKRRMASWPLRKKTTGRTLWMVTTLATVSPAMSAEQSLPVALRLTNQAAVDQDDLCIWSPAAAPGRGALIVSDKAAGQIFVYDLQGMLGQTIAVRHPGNIDLRSQVVWGDSEMTLCVVNERETNKLLAFSINPQSGQLERLDDDSISTGENYGGALLHQRDAKRLDFLVTSKMNGARQWELSDNGQGKLTGREVRRWALGACEGAVGDDRTGHFFVSVESEGVYRLTAAPHDEKPAELVVRVGENGLVGDVEGLAIVEGMSGARYLVLSDQGASQFRIYRLGERVEYHGAFSVAEVERTDGLDVTFASCGESFPMGLFACHSDVEEGRIMRVVDGAPLRVLFP